MSSDLQALEENIRQIKESIIQEENEYRKARDKLFGIRAMNTACGRPESMSIEEDELTVWRVNLLKERERLAILESKRENLLRELSRETQTKL